MDRREKQDAEAPPGFGQRHLQVALLFVALVAAYLYRINMSICIVEMTDVKANRTDVKVYAWSKAQQGYVLSSFFWGYVLTQVPAGALAVRFGPKWFLLLAIAGCAALSALTPIAADLGGWQLVVAWRALQGLVQGFLYPCTHAMLSRWLPPLERGRYSALVYMGMTVGTVVSLAGSGALARSPLGWPSGFWVPALLGLAWAVPWVLLAADSPAACRRIGSAERDYIEASFRGTSSAQQGLAVPWRSILTSLPMWSLIVVHCGQNFGHIALLTETPTYMKEALGLDIDENGVMSALPYITLCVTSVLVSIVAPYANRYVSLNFSRKFFQSLAHWGSGTTMLLLGVLDVDAAWAVALLCVAVGVEAGTLVGYLCNHMDLSPNFGGAMMGVTNCAAAVVAILAPIVVSLITGDADTHSEEESVRRWKVVFILSACIYYGGNLFWVVFGSTRVQPWNDPNHSKPTVGPRDDVEPKRADSGSTPQSRYPDICSTIEAAKDVKP